MRLTRPLATAALCGAVALAAGSKMSARARRFPSLSELPATPFSLQDVALSSCGMRAAAADLAWVQMLQYAAGRLMEMPPDRPGRSYDQLKTMAQRVVRLDPSFHRAYLYGAGILGWFRGVDRPDEAVELLEEGLRRDPGEPLYSLYIAALAFKNKGQADKMIALLETTFDDPQTPTQMKTILANTRKARGEYEKAIGLWERVLENPHDASEHPRARQQVSELERLLRARKP
ncbi:MAG: tetratricopeptide repeat protein [Elusimicrobiota bacterium]